VKSGSPGYKFIGLVFCVGMPVWTKVAHNRRHNLYRRGELALNAGDLTSPEAPAMEYLLLELAGFLTGFF
jgi:hypothetical protein